MKIANRDVTYCTNEKCKNKCWRNVVNYSFDDNENYSFMEKCEKYKEEIL